mmetsp:Transcript_15187/g.40760  ORF Transcript_15187/g.40760 Transcript_15187/m.40760 type:complete len:285 (-) Transcript_15187:16-870(-)
MTPSSSARRAVSRTVLRVVICAARGYSSSTTSATSAKRECCVCSGCTNHSISACVNSRTRNSPALGEISLRKELPICATPNGSFPPLNASSRAKLTKMPCAVSGRKKPGTFPAGPIVVANMRLNAYGAPSKPPVSGLRASHRTSACRISSTSSSSNRSRSASASSRAAASPATAGQPSSAAAPAADSTAVSSGWPFAPLSFFARFLRAARTNGCGLSSMSAERWSPRRWSARKHSPVASSFTRMSANLSTCPDALSTGAGVSAEHSSSSRPSATTKCSRHSAVR